MRTTVSIDDDVFTAVRSIAQSTSQSMGKVLSDLVRKSLSAGTPATRHPKTGFPVFVLPADSPLVTDEDVDRCEDEV